MTNRFGTTAGRMAALVLALASTACTDQQDPLAPEQTAVAAAAGQEQSFFFYGDEQIPLVVEAGEVSVESSLPPTAPARAVLATLGVSVKSAERLPQAANHWVLQLSGADQATTAQAARALRADSRFNFAASVYRVASSNARVVLLNRVGVKLTKGWSRGDLARLNAAFGTRVVREPVAAEPDVVWLEYRRGGDPLDLAAQLRQDPLVEWADPDKVQAWQRAAVPSDPFYADQYYLHNNTLFNGVRVDINAEFAWDLSYGAWSAAAGPLVIAVVDDGVEITHPDMYDYRWGYDAFTGTFQNPGCTSCSVNPGGNYSHGTLVAGVIRADHNNGSGMAGVAPAAQIMPIRIFNDVGSPASDNQIAQAINTAWYNGAHVMNNSWGGGSVSTAIQSAIGRAVTEGRGGKGTVMVFAAGNTSRRGWGQIGAVQFPGTLSNVLTVSAINRNGFVTDYAPDGAAIDVVAPSGHTTDMCVGDIISTDLTGSRGCNDGPGGNVDYSSTFSGTSAAAPQAAAVAAMVLSRNPTWTELQIRDRVKASADPWGTANTFGAGKLNAYRAIVGRVGISTSGTTRPSTAGQYTWTASGIGGAGSYSYVWEKRPDGSSTWYTVGSGSSYTDWVGNDETFALRVTVTDGPDAQTASRSFTVFGPVTSNCLVAGADSAGNIILPPACP